MKTLTEYLKEHMNPSNEFVNERLTRTTQRKNLLPDEKRALQNRILKRTNYVKGESAFEYNLLKEVITKKNFNINAFISS